MPKSEDLYKNKIKLIYEYNRKSPLFVRIASWELEENNIDAAIEILIDGLSGNPEYPTSYFILGKAYSAKGDYSKALNFYRKGSALIHSQETYQYYTREIESLKKLRTSSEDSAGNMAKINPDNKVIESGVQSSFEDNLGELAKKISGAKIPAMSEANDDKINYDEEPVESGMIVSETLAKIFITQGETKEAINIYKKLIKKEPAKENYYSRKIAELELKL